MLTERLIEYEHDGTLLEGFLAWDDSAGTPLPAVMISHAWAGRADFECDKARALAGLGYAGFALDLYGKGVLGGGPEENAKLMQPFMQDRKMLLSRLKASLEIMRSQPEVDSDRVAAVGFCFGGLCVLDLARSGEDLRGVISLHGFFTPPSDATGSQIKAKILALHGHDDPMVSMDTLVEAGKEFTAAGADWQIHVYGNALHGFTNPKANNPDLGTVYNETADRRAWQSVQNFLAEVLA